MTEMKIIEKTDPPDAYPNTRIGIWNSFHAFGFLCRFQIQGHAKPDVSHTVYHGTTRASMQQIVGVNAICPNNGKVYTTVDFATAQHPSFALPERCNGATIQYIVEGSLADISYRDRSSSWPLSSRLNVDFACESVRSSAVPVTGVWVVVFVA